MDKILEVVYKAIDEIKGENVTTYDFKKINPFIDAVVITSASNLRQVYSIADNIKVKMREAGYEKIRLEGNSQSRWVLVDLDTVIVHVFLEEEREVYQLDRLYADLDQISNR
ncbi:MAG: ribosome silencing factor [Erysipelotrichaceae bacterium]